MQLNRLIRFHLSQVRAHDLGARFGVSKCHHFLTRVEERQQALETEDCWPGRGLPRPGRCGHDTGPSTAEISATAGRLHRLHRDLRPPARGCRPTRTAPAQGELVDRDERRIWAQDGDVLVGEQ